MELDAVVTWIDTTDEYYIKCRNEYFGSAQPYDRFRVGKRDELRFCLRGLYYNLPWLRKIYLVCWGNQFPDWLDEDACAKLNPPIIRVSRDSLNNGVKTYGSIACEALLYRIPGLSDLFIYANTDMFILKKMEKAEWVDNNGIGILQRGIYIEDCHLEDYYFKKYISNQIELFEQSYPSHKIKFFYPSHMAWIISKQSYADIISKYPEIYNKTLQMQGREQNEFIGIAFLDYVAVQNNYCKTVVCKNRIYLEHTDDYPKIILDKDAVFMCTNLNCCLEKSKYDDYISFMTTVFPLPLPSEKFLRYEDRYYYIYHNYKGHVSDKQFVWPCFVAGDRFDVIKKYYEMEAKNRS